MHLTKKQIAFRAIVFAALVLLVSAGSAMAQTTDVLKVTYFNNNQLRAPLAFMHVLNPGLGALCADVYVWRADQELTECCSCPISNNGLLTFQLLAATVNPGDGGDIPVSGSIDIIADSTSDCTDAAAAAPTPTPTLRAWATHVNVDTTGTFDVTETPFVDATLSSGQLAEAAGRCAAIQANDSGHGLCDQICAGIQSDVKTRTK